MRWVASSAIARATLAPVSVTCSGWLMTSRTGRSAQPTGSPATSRTMSRSETMPAGAPSSSTTRHEISCSASRRATSWRFAPASTQRTSGDMCSVTRSAAACSVAPVTSTNASTTPEYRPTTPRT